MQLIRHPQACMEIRAKEKTVFVDPGTFGVPENLGSAEAIFITHYHFDHADTAAIAHLLATKPVPVYGPAALAAAVDFPVRTVTEDEEVVLDDLHVKVCGAWQDVTSIYDPPIENLGYLFEDVFLHPGDALPRFYNLPAVALPLAAPWAKRADMERYLAEYRPQSVVSVHDITLNALGLDFALQSMAEMCRQVGIQFYPLKVGQRLSL
ncbi:MAG: MBL fold metallo-hydrolase [Veillonellaceae bacterium]|nr:MBL fold metallo-hydrolase [Veillonellaceae bacterium]